MPGIYLVFKEQSCSQHLSIYSTLSRLPVPYFVVIVPARIKCLADHLVAGNNIAGRLGWQALIMIRP